MSSNPNFKRRATDASVSPSANENPRERRARARRKPGDFCQEIEPLLSSVDPGVRDEIQDLVKTGKVAEAKKELMEYVVADDKASLVQKILRKKVSPVERMMAMRFLAVSLIPVLILLYCIFCLLLKGHLETPW